MSFLSRFCMLSFCYLLSYFLFSFGSFLILFNFLCVLNVKVAALPRAFYTKEKLESTN